jgi:FkbM family methyltransferase
VLKLARIYARYELPRAMPILVRFGMNNHHAWQNEREVEFRERYFGYHVRCDLRDFYQRAAYFHGCYHERHILGSISPLTRAGDECIDGGANIGLVTLHMAGCVGPGGRVIAFEPAPAMVSALRWHVARNRLSNVRVRDEGLSDAAEERTYTLPDGSNWGSGTLGPVPERYGQWDFIRARVRTVRGDAARQRRLGSDVHTIAYHRRTHERTRYVAQGFLARSPPHLHVHRHP